MSKNYFHKLSRVLAYERRIAVITPRYDCLDPDRMVYRAMYGTDYDPSSQSLVFISPMA